jgi:hypothetical protein
LQLASKIRKADPGKRTRENALLCESRTRSSVSRIAEQLDSTPNGAPATFTVVSGTEINTTG